MVPAAPVCPVTDPASEPAGHERVVAAVVEVVDAVVPVVAPAPPPPLEDEDEDDECEEQAPATRVSASRATEAAGPTRADGRPPPRPARFGRPGPLRR